MKLKVWKEREGNEVKSFEMSPFLSKKMWGRGSKEHTQKKGKRGSDLFFSLIASQRSLSRKPLSPPLLTALWYIRRGYGGRRVFSLSLLSPPLLQVGLRPNWCFFFSFSPPSSLSPASLSVMLMLWLRPLLDCSSRDASFFCKKGNSFPKRSLALLRISQSYLGSETNNIFFVWKLVKLEFSLFPKNETIKCQIWVTGSIFPPEAERVARVNILFGAKNPSLLLQLLLLLSFQIDRLNFFKHFCSYRVAMGGGHVQFVDLYIQLSFHFPSFPFLYCPWRIKGTP